MRAALQICLIVVGTTAALHCAAKPGAGSPSVVDVKRTEPEGDLNPTVVTRRLMAQIARGAWPLKRFVDPKRGVVIVHYEEYDNSEGPKHEAKLLCCPHLTAELPRIQKQIAESLDTIECQNKPTQECSKPGEEYSPRVTFLFETMPNRGVVLVSVTFLSTAGAREEFKQQAAKFVADALSRSSASPCP